MVLQKVRKQGIRFWDKTQRTFWHEIIYTSLIPTFGKLTARSEPKVGIKTYINYLMPECSLRPKTLFLVSLLFVALLNSIPTYLL